MGLPEFAGAFSTPPYLKLFFLDSTDQGVGHIDRKQSPDKAKTTNSPGTIYATRDRWNSRLCPDMSLLLRAPWIIRIDAILHWGCP